MMAKVLIKKKHKEKIGRCADGEKGHHVKGECVPSSGHVLLASVCV